MIVECLSIRRSFFVDSAALLIRTWGNCDSISWREGERTSVKFVLLSNDMNELSLFTRFYGDISRRGINFRDYMDCISNLLHPVIKNFDTFGSKNSTNASKFKGDILGLSDCAQLWHRSLNS